MSDDPDVVRIHRKNFEPIMRLAFLRGWDAGVSEHRQAYIPTERRMDACHHYVRDFLATYGDILDREEVSDG